MKGSIIPAAFVLATLVGCASTIERQAKDMAGREKIQREAEEDRRDYAQKQAKRQLKAIPDWALETPAPDSTGIYGIGIAQSDLVPTAMRKAELQGKYALAKQVSEVMSGMERSHVTDNGQTTLDGYSQRVESLVDWTDVVGVETVKQEVLPIDGRFHAFYLYKMPFAAVNKVLLERQRQAHNASEREAFEELARRLQTYRASQAAVATTAQPPSLEPLVVTPATTDDAGLTREE